MARYVGSVCRLCRREGAKLFLKGDRCYSEKCAIEKRNYPPGMHGQGRARFSDFGVQLREKQKVKRIYGLLEKQFRRTFAKASSMKGRSGEQMLMLLERRLDNVVFRMGFATSRFLVGPRLISRRSQCPPEPVKNKHLRLEVQTRSTR